MLVGQDLPPSPSGLLAYVGFARGQSGGIARVRGRTGFQLRLHSANHLPIQTNTDRVQSYNYKVPCSHCKQSCRNALVQLTETNQQQSCQDGYSMSKQTVEQRAGSN